MSNCVAGVFSKTGAGLWASNLIKVHHVFGTHFRAYAFMFN